jgi:hypothetical protein
MKRAKSASPCWGWRPSDDSGAVGRLETHFALREIRVGVDAVTTTRKRIRVFDLPTRRR